MSNHYRSPAIHVPNSVRTPKFIAHRGYTPDAPENSIPSFQGAGAKGYWAIETDVRVTSDGVLVCNHNATIDAMYNGTGKILEMTYAETQDFMIKTGNRIEAYSPEQLRMPTFEQYLQICRYYGSVPFLELKTDAVQAVVEQLMEFGMENHAVISSSSLDFLKKVREVSQRIFVHHIFSSMEQAHEVASLGNAGLALNYTDIALVPDADIRRLHTMGLLVCFRAGDTEQSVKDMIRIGADYIPTNCMFELRD